MTNHSNTNIASPLFNIYLAGEIHSSWRDDLKNAVLNAGLSVEWSSPVTDHEASDDCGATILGAEDNSFWHDRKGAELNAIRTHWALNKADCVIVKFGEKYKQWNAAFDAGQASALNKSLIVIQPEQFDHALKEINAAALAVCRNESQVVNIIRYILNGELPR